MVPPMRSHQVLVGLGFQAEIHGKMESLSAKLTPPEFPLPLRPKNQTARKKLIKWRKEKKEKKKKIRAFRLCLCVEVAEIQRFPKWA